MTSIVDNFVTIEPQEASALLAFFTSQHPSDMTDKALIDADQELIRQKTERTRAAWRKICPPLYDQTDASRIPAAILDEVMPIDMGAGRGLFIYGKPGTFKTRATWLKLAYEFTRNHRSVCYLTPHDFALSASASMGARDANNEYGGGWWISRMIHQPDILFLDDAFKNRITEAQEFALFAIIEGRMNACKATCITSNKSIDAIPELFTGNGAKMRADALTRRIGESCEVLAV